MMKLTILRCFIHIYDFLTLPIFVLLDKPWRRWTAFPAAKPIFSCAVNLQDPESVYKSVIEETATLADHFKEFKTCGALISGAMKKNATKHCLGYRKTVAEEVGLLPDGKPIRKKQLENEYTWLTYREVNRKIDWLIKGLTSQGVKKGDKLAIMMETRFEWQLFAQAALRAGFTLCTLYPNIGRVGIEHALKELEAKLLITSCECLKLIRGMEEEIPDLETIIVCGDFKQTEQLFEGSRFKVITMEKLIDSILGNEVKIDHLKPKASDLALIMYTSGSSGLPKGVLLTQRNVLKAFLSMASIAPQNRSKDTFLAFLPLAHVFPFVIELYMIAFGARIGYGTPNTLIDGGHGLLKDCPGDATILKPTAVICVPLLCNKLENSIKKQVASKNKFFEEFFFFALEYKAFWRDRGFRTPLLDRILINKTSVVMGGQLKEIIVGGAPLSCETQKFLSLALNCFLSTGYGATETTTVCSSMFRGDRNLGRIGAPLKGVYLKLQSWPEANYFLSDKPNPRGELLIGGEFVSSGYFKRDQETERCFFQDEKDKKIRWFLTGDIVEYFPEDGTLRIIDRKKDLVKMQNGEYVSLGKVEATLKTCPLVENICAFGESRANFISALVLPNRQVVEQIALQLGKSYANWERTCRDAEIAKRALEMLQESGKSSGLGRLEIPVKLKLCAEDWTPITDLVTATLKIRRKELYGFYRTDLENFYNDNQSATAINNNNKLL